MWSELVTVKILFPGEKINPASTSSLAFKKGLATMFSDRLTAAVVSDWLSFIRSAEKRSNQLIHFWLIKWVEAVHVSSTCFLFLKFLWFIYKNNDTIIYVQSFISGLQCFKMCVLTLISQRKTNWHHHLKFLHNVFRKAQKNQMKVRGKMFTCFPIRTKNMLQSLLLTQTEIRDLKHTPSI